MSLPEAVPVVSLNRVAGASVLLVGSDHHQTGVLAAQHLLSLGHSRVGSVTGPGDRQVTRSRLEGFRDTLLAGGVTLDASAVVGADWSSAGALDAARRLLEADGGITAIFAHADVMALGVLRALSERDIRVPDDCSVVSCDDLAFAEFMSPPLSTVRILFEETGALGASTLARRIRGEDVPRRALLPVAFVERASTARPPRRRRPRNDHDDKPDSASTRRPAARRDT